MLSNNALKNIETIKINASKIWGNNAVFGELKPYPYPFSAFSWDLTLYGKYNVRIEYDRSIMGIHFGEGEKDVGLFQAARKALDKKTFYGFESTEPEKMLHNFEVLDEFIRTGGLD